MRVSILLKECSGSRILRPLVLVVTSLLLIQNAWAGVPCGTTPGRANFVQTDELYYAVLCLYYNSIYCSGPTLHPSAQGSEQKVKDWYGAVIGDWCVGLVTNLDNMFAGLTTLNEPLSNWNTSSVTSMRQTFYITSTFNQPLPWDASNVKDFYATFLLSKFNSALDWDLRSAENTAGMFAASPFNQDISEWNLTNNKDFRSMFYGAVDFNQDLSNWDVRRGCRFDNMFDSAILFKQDLNSWLSKLTTLSTCPDSVYVFDMFVNSSCPVKSDPLPNGPFCVATQEPSTAPSRTPSQRPSMLPSASPSRKPSMLPSRNPTSLPSAQPSVMPSIEPSSSTSPSFTPVRKACLRSALNSRKWCCKQRAQCLEEIRDDCRQSFLDMGRTREQLRERSKRVYNNNCS